MLMAFGLGLIPFSAQYLMLRGFYAFEDTKTPFVIAAWIAAINSLLSLASYYALSSTQWAVTGMCVAYVIAYTVGMVMTGSKLSRKLRGMDTTRVIRTHAKLAAAAALAAVVGGPIAYEITKMVRQPMLAAGSALLLGGLLFAAIFVVASRRMRVEEVDSLLGTLRARFGR
jgi:putative peptidoglycan lipid II flippase